MKTVVVASCDWQQLPLPLPYETIEGDLGLGGDAWVRIEELALESPLASGQVTGSVGRAARFGSAPLRLQLEFTVSQAIRGSLTSQGVKVGQGGQVRLAVTGTPDRPVVR